MKTREKLAELKRRMIGRIVIGYCVIAMGAIGLAADAFPRISMPDWTVTMVVLLAIMGLPLAIAIAWTHETEQEGVPPSRRRRVTQAVLYFVAPLVLLTSSYLLARSPLFTGSQQQASAAVPTAAAAPAATAIPDRSIAVLPFANLSPDQENAYFSDGITEELTTKLSYLQGVKVPARTSAAEFKNRNLDVREIARRLGVATVLEGSVRKSGQSIRVTAQWIDARNGYHLWAQNFDTRLTDIFAVQDSIAIAIASALQVELAQLDSAGDSRGTQDAVAYDLYLKGRYLERQDDPATQQKAIETLRAAVKRDPSYAAAHATLAGAYVDLARRGDTSAYARAKAASNRALQLAPNSDAARGALQQLAALKPAAPAVSSSVRDEIAAAITAGQTAAALAAIEKALADGALTEQQLRTDSIFDPLRRNIRFARLLK